MTEEPETAASGSAPVYLNNAATAWPLAPGVVEAVSAAMTALPAEAGRTTARGADALADCRERLARLLGVGDPGRVILTASATHALNTAIQGLRLGPDSHVVTTATEHNSALRPLRHLQRIHERLRVTVVGLDGHGVVDVEAFAKAVGGGADLVVVTHVSNVTGHENDAPTLFRLAHEAGAVTLLDASQSLGHAPVDARALGADMVAFTGHKGLRGPQGAGGLYVSPDLELEPLIVGGTGGRSDLETQPAEMPTRLEAGTPNAQALAGLAAALSWREVEGGAFVASETERLAALVEGLRAIEGVRLFGSERLPRYGLVSFGVRGWTVEEAGFALEASFGIVCRTGLHCAPLIHAGLGAAPDGTIRLSPSGFTSEADIERALAAVRMLARS